MLLSLANMVLKNLKFNFNYISRSESKWERRDRQMRPGLVPPPRLSDFNYPTHFWMADGKVFHSPNKFQIASLSRPVHILAGNKSFWAINLQVCGARPRTEQRKNICSRRCTQIAKELAVEQVALDRAAGCGWGGQDFMSCRSLIHLASISA